MNELVSIIIPTTRRNHISKCVDSILSQTYKNIEIIIVDDKSDNTQDFYYKKVFGKIKIKINHSRIGTAESRNIGYNLISEKSKFVMFHDDDDLSHNNKIETLVTYLNNYPNVDFVGSLFSFIDENENMIEFKKLSIHTNWYTRSFNYEPIFYTSHITNHFTPSTVLIRKNVCDVVIPFKNVFDEDHEFFNRLLMNGFIGVNIPKILTRKKVLNDCKTINRSIEHDSDTVIIKNEYGNFIHKIFDNKGIKKIYLIVFYDGKDIEKLKSFVSSASNNFMSRHKIDILIFSNKNIRIDNKLCTIVVDDFDCSDHFDLYRILLKYKMMFYGTDYIYKINYNCKIIEHVDDDFIHDMFTVIDSKDGDVTDNIYGSSTTTFFNMINEIYNNYVVYNENEKTCLSKYIKRLNDIYYMDKCCCLYEDVDFECKDQHLVKILFNK